MAIVVKTLTDDMVSMPGEALDGLRMAFRAGVFVDGDPEYEQARVVWNAMIDKRPAIIIRCSGAADVIEAVTFARLRNLLVAVRAGGHSVAGLSTCDGGVLIDLSPMDGVRVEPADESVWAFGGATWGGIDKETQIFGSATPGGVVSNTGVAGLTLGGGIGQLRRRYGLSCDNLVAAELVTAEGELLSTSEQQEPDLFWALRGGGGNFGVVTSMKFRTHTIGQRVAYSLLVFAIDDAPDVFRAWKKWQSTVTDDVTSHIVIWTVQEGLPPLEGLIGQQVVVVTAMHAARLDDGLKELASLRDIGTPLVDLSGLPWTYRVVQSGFDPLFAPKGKSHAYFKSMYLNELGDDAIDLIVKRGMERPNPMTLFNLAQMGGAIDDVGVEETAFAARGAKFMLSIDGLSFDANDVGTFVPWVRDFWDEMQRFADGGPYLNFLGAQEQGEEALVRSAYGPNYERLSQIKKRYDPDNFFRMNQNIPPAN